MANFVLFGYPPPYKNGPGMMVFSCPDGQEDALVERKLGQTSHTTWELVEKGPGGFETAGAAKRAGKARAEELEARREAWRRAQAEPERVLICPRCRGAGILTGPYAWDAFGSTWAYCWICDGKKRVPRPSVEAPCSGCLGTSHHPTCLQMRAEKGLEGDRPKTGETPACYRAVEVVDVILATARRPSCPTCGIPYADGCLCEKRS